MNRQAMDSHVSLSWAILSGRCPACRQGKIMNGLLSVRPRCAVCDRNFLPESGYFLGAMMVAYVMTGVLTIPTLILLKIFGAELNLLLGLPLLQYVLMAPILLRYSRIIWIHAEYSTSRRLDRES